MSVKEQYWKYSLITIILGLGLILFIKMSPFMGGILGACTIYIMVRKQMFYLTQEKHFKKSITAILLLIEAIMCFLVPLSLAVWLLINKLQTVNVDTTGFIHTVTNLADWLHTKTGYDLLNAENISSIASILPAIGQFLMGSISSFAVNAFVLVFVLYFMLIGGIQMEKYIYELEMKVRDYECDLQGIVNNANYQHYLEHTRHEFLLSTGVSFAKLHEQGVDPVVARINMAFKTPLKSGDEFISKLYMKKEGIKYVFYQDIFRKSDDKVAIKAVVETVCVVNGRLSDSELFDKIFEPYLTANH